MSLGIHQTDAPNLAPIAPLTQGQQPEPQEPSPPFAEWWKKKKEAYEAENKPTWDQTHLMTMLIFLFIEGKQLLRRSTHQPNTWRAVDIPQRTDSPVHALNCVEFYATNIKAKWTNSRTRQEIRGQSDADDDKGKAKAAQVINDHYETRDYTPLFSLTEAGLALAGFYARYHYYSDEANGGFGVRPVVEEQPVQFGEDTFICADCGGMGSAGQLAGQSQPGGAGSAQPANTSGSDLTAAASGLPPTPGQSTPGSAAAGQGLPNSVPGLSAPTAGNQSPLGGAPAAGTCPYCGSPNVAIQPAPPAQTLPVVTGQEKFKLGDLVTESVPQTELRWDLASGKEMEEANWMRRKRRIRLTTLRAKFKGLKIQPSETDDSGLRVSEDLKQSASTSSGQQQVGRKGKGAGMPDSADFTQFWLKPDEYDDYIFPEDTQTLSGGVIPAGTKLIDLCPESAYIADVAGCEGQVDIHNEMARDHWASGVYMPKALSSQGVGIQSIIEAQRMYNLVMSIIYEMLRTSAWPATLVNEAMLPGGVSRYLGHGKKNIPVNMAGADQGWTLEHAVKQLQPVPPSAQHFGMAEQLQYQMQRASHVMDFSGGAPGVNNKTATGAEILDSNSDALFAPTLSIKGGVDTKSARIRIKLFKTHCFDQRWITLKGKRGALDGQWFSSSDVDDEAIVIEPVKDSWLPQTSRDRRERYLGALQVVGGIPGLIEASKVAPGIVGQISERFDVEFDLENYDSAAENGRLRIEAMKQMLPVAQQLLGSVPAFQTMANPETGEPQLEQVDPRQEVAQLLVQALKPQVNPLEVGHLAAVQFYREWISDDEGREADEILRAAVEQLVMLHLQFAEQEEMIMARFAMLGDPALQAQPPQESSSQKNQKSAAANRQGSTKPQPSPGTSRPSPKPHQPPTT